MAFTRIDSLHLAIDENKQLEGPVEIGELFAEGGKPYGITLTKEEDLAPFKEMQSREKAETGEERPLNEFYQYASYLGIKGDARIEKLKLGDFTTIEAKAAAHPQKGRIALSPQARLDLKHCSTAFIADDRIEYSPQLLYPPQEEVLERYEGELQKTSSGKQIELTAEHEKYLAAHHKPHDVGVQACWGAPGQLSSPRWDGGAYARSIHFSAPHIKEHYEPLLEEKPKPSFTQKVESKKSPSTRNAPSKWEWRKALKTPLFETSWVYPQVTYQAPNWPMITHSYSDLGTHHASSLDIGRMGADTLIRGFDFVKIHTVNQPKTDIECGECHITNCYSAGAIPSRAFVIEARHSVTIDHLFQENHHARIEFSAKDDKKDMPLEVTIGSIQPSHDLEDGTKYYGGMIELGRGPIDLRVKESEIAFDIEKHGHGTHRVFLDYPVNHAGHITADEIHLIEKPERPVGKDKLVLEGKVYINNRLVYPDGVELEPQKQSKRRGRQP